MTAPAGRGRDDATIRGAVVLVVAIIVGLALLWRGGTSDGDDGAQAADNGTTESTSFESSVETDAEGNTVSPVTSGDQEGGDDTRPRDMVAVIVLNGTPTEVAGLAGQFSTRAAEAGFQTLDSANATEKVETSAIYAAPGFELDAQALQVELELTGATITAKPDESLGQGDELADVVVVLGGDAAE